MKRKRWCVWVRFKADNKDGRRKWEPWGLIATFENVDSWWTAHRGARYYLKGEWTAPGQAIALPEGRKPK